MLSSLEKSLGELSGRLPKSPSRWTFVLGSVAEWQFEPLVPGDYTEVFQEFDMFGSAGVRVHVRLAHPPLALTEGKRWGVYLTGTNCEPSPVRFGFPGRTREFDLFIKFPSSESHQTVRVAIRMELQ